MTQAEFFEKLAALRKRHPRLPVVIEVQTDEVLPADECKWQHFKPAGVEVRHFALDKYHEAIYDAGEIDAICEKILNYSGIASADENLPNYEFLKKYLRDHFQKSYRRIVVRVKPA